MQYNRHEKFGLQTNIIEIETLLTTPHTHNTSLIDNTITLKTTLTLTPNRTHPTLSTRTHALPYLSASASPTGPSLLSLRDTIVHYVTLHNTH